MPRKDSRFCSPVCQQAFWRQTHRESHRESLRRRYARDLPRRREKSRLEGQKAWQRLAREERAAADAYASGGGWPSGLSGRQVQALNFLAAAGVPLRIPDLASLMGVASFAAVAHWLGTLVAVGLVAALPGLGRHRKDASTEYTLSPTALSLLEERARAEEEDHG